MTSYFSEEKYSGELIQWSASNGVFEAIVRARHHQQVSQPGGELIMDQTSRYLSFLFQVSFSPGYSGLLSRSIRQIKVGSNWDEREKIFRYPPELSKLSSRAFNQNINLELSIFRG